MKKYNFVTIKTSIEEKQYTVGDVLLDIPISDAFEFDTINSMTVKDADDGEITPVWIILVEDS